MNSNIENVKHYFISASQKTSIACIDQIGKKSAENADSAAVEKMRDEFNKIPIQGKIVIGEGERDNAPMLFIGEKVGLQCKDPSYLHLQNKNENFEYENLCRKNQNNHFQHHSQESLPSNLCHFDYQRHYDQRYYQGNLQSMTYHTLCHAKINSYKKLNNLFTKNTLNCVKSKYINSSEEVYMSYQQHYVHQQYINFHYCGYSKNNQKAPYQLQDHGRREICMENYLSYMSEYCLHRSNLCLVKYHYHSNLDL